MTTDQEETRQKTNDLLAFVLYSTSSWVSICALTCILLLGGINHITGKDFWIHHISQCIVDLPERMKADCGTADLNIR